MGRQDVPLHATAATGDDLTMKRILYATGSFLTDDVVADALMDYANVLAIVDSADVVHFPGVDDSGAVRDVQLLIGPSSQIAAIATDDESVDMPSAEAALELRRRAEVRLPNSTDVGDASGL